MLLTIVALITFFGSTHIALKVVELQQVRWIRQTWTAYLNNIANHVNPTHETLPGDM
jgi:hypothetical protein